MWESEVPLTIATWAPSSSGTESGIQYLESGILKVESRFQDNGSWISLVRATEEHGSKTIKSDDNLIPTDKTDKLIKDPIDLSYARNTIWKTMHNSGKFLATALHLLNQNKQNH